MKNLAERVSVLEKKLKINESVKSEALRRFFELLKTQNKNKESLKIILRGIPKLSWSELTDLDVLFLTPEKAREYAKDDTKIVIWGFNRRKGIENAAKDTYFNPWDFVLTRGKKFIFFDFRNEGKFGTEGQVNTGYNPYKNYVSYLSLSTRYADFALVIDLETFSKSLASTTELRKLRKEFREFEFYFRDNLKLAHRNIENYKIKKALLKGKERAKTISVEIEEILSELKSRIKSYSVSNFFREIEKTVNSTDISISKLGNNYKYTYFEFDSKMNLLKEISEIYNSLSRKLAYYIDNLVIIYKSGANPDGYLNTGRENEMRSLRNKAKILIQEFDKLEY